MNEIDVQHDTTTGLEIAIIGMAGRFPGADNIETFWKNLLESKESITYFTEEELLEAGLSKQSIDNPLLVKAWGWMDRFEYFDASFFGYTPLESELMDPQMRVFHEVVYTGLENAGYDSFTFKKPIGLYAGASANTEWQAMAQMSGKNDIVGGWFPSKQLNDKDFLATRIAHRLNLKGPAITVDTACSTSMIALHLACQGLISSDCDMAVAGGVAIYTFKKNGYLYQEGMLLSPDGHCRTFDAKAKGCCFGNAAAVVVLKRLDDAIEDGDTIWAVIKGTSINNDGSRKAAYTAPSIEGQSGVIRAALQMAEISPETIGYIEAHGTATPLGDPVEIESLKRAFKTDKKQYCRIGSVKSNVGHLEMAAGVTGIIKTALILKHHVIPASLHFETPSPSIDFENSPFIVNTKLTAWPEGKYPRRAGVSSFGIGGTNGHAVLQEYRESSVSNNRSMDKPDENALHFIPLSARSESALEQMTSNLKTFLENNKDVELSHVAFTLQTGRHVFQDRRMIVASSIEETIKDLENPNSSRVKTYVSEEDGKSVIFLYPGLGSQYVNMGRGLYESQPVFREAMDRCFKILSSLGQSGIKDILYPPQSINDPQELNRINQVQFSQIAVFIFEYALTELLIRLGIKPSSMIGYSFGEYSAALAAGVFTLEEGLKLVVTRGKLIQQLTPGAMLSVPLPKGQVLPLLEPGLSLAIDNGPSCVVAGKVDLVNEFEARMKERRIMCVKMQATHAIHTSMMNPVLDQFESLFREIKLKKPAVSYLSNVTGQWIKEAEATDPKYWIKHLSQPVEFASGIQTLVNGPNAIFIEVGPGRDIGTLATRYFEEKTGKEKKDHHVIQLTRNPNQDTPDLYFLYSRIGRLWLYGQPIDWTVLHPKEKRKRIPLPTYPYESKRFWIDVKFDVMSGQSKASLQQLRKPDLTDWFNILSWKRCDTNGETFIETPPGTPWIVFTNGNPFNQALTGQLEKEHQQIFTIKTGEKFRSESSHRFTINPKNDDDYDSLFKTLHQNGVHPRFILHLWGVTGAQDIRSLSTQDSTLRDLGFHSLVSIARAIGKIGIRDHIRLEAITDRMQEVVGGDGLFPEKITVLGPVKVIPTEFPNIGCRSIDIVLPSPGSQDETKLIHQIVNEFKLEKPVPVVAYRGHYRWIQHFEVKRIEESQKANTPLRKEGVYLITGGLGGIGYSIAQFLSRDFKARLILTGRTPLPPRDEWSRLNTAALNFDDLNSKIQRIKELELSGSEVTVYDAESSDFEKMKYVIDETLKRYGTIHGVIHCAGLADGEMIQLRNREASERLFRSKITGTKIIDRLLEDTPIDFLMLCSSITAVVPMLGQVGYCAANAYLDAFSHYRNSVRNRLTLSINYDRWQNIGIAVIVEAQHKKLTKEKMEGGITAEEGVEVFNRALAARVPQVIICTVNLNHMIEKASKSFLEGLQKIDVSKTAVDRKDLDSDYVAPRNESEHKLAGIWSDFFGFDQIGVQDDFFQLGGDSLKALMLLPRIHKEMHVDIPIAEFFKNPTIEKLSQHMLDAGKEEYFLIQPAEKKEYYELSSAQQRLFVLQQIESEILAYNIPGAWTLVGKLDEQKLEYAFAQLIERNESLRTSFDLIDDKPVQKVFDTVDFQIEFLSENTIKAFIRPFDLSRAPLFRVGLQVVDPETHILIIDMHHIITDGMSLGILVQNFAQLYSGIELSPLNVHYKDFAEWQNREKLTEKFIAQETFWKKEFEEEIPVLTLPTDYVRPAQQSYEGDTIYFELGAESLASLRTLASSSGTTNYMVYLALYTIFLSRICHQEDIVVGTPVAGRKHTDLEKMIGMFVNTLALRNYPKGEKHLLQYLQEVKDKMIKVFENQDYQYEELVEHLSVVRDPSRNPLFDTLFSLQNTGIEALEIPGLRVEPYSYGNKTSKFDLSLLVFEMRETVAFAFEYCTKLFKRESIDQFIRCFKNIVSSVITLKNPLISEIDIISPEEKKQILIDFNATETPYDHEKTLDQLIFEQAEQHPDHIVLIGPMLSSSSVDSPAVQITYRELIRKSESLAQLLRENGAGPGIIVGIKLERSLEMIIAIVAILTAGGAYLPIDTEYPQERIDYMLKDSGAEIILNERLEHLETNGFNEIIRAERLQENGFNEIIRAKRLQTNDFTNASPLQGTASNLAYIIYTSGSTGKPKGVMIEHKQVVNFITGIKSIIPFTPKDRIFSLTTISFDIFGLETLLPLVSASTVIVGSREEQFNTTAAALSIVKNNASIFQITPTRLQLFLNNPSARRALLPLSYLLVGGEVFPGALYQAVRPITRARIFNMYGPTETTIWSTVKEVKDLETLNIGKPIANTQIYIEDKNNHTQPKNLVGELIIGGDGVARGYLNQPELTHEKFITNPHREKERRYKTGDLAKFLPDGEIQCLGRIDTQIKIRGYRIELGEIEHLLSKHKEIREVAVICKNDPKGEKTICAYVVPEPGVILNPDDLRTYLSGKLPEYMIPSSFMSLETMPMTPGGKIDQRSLPEPEIQVGKSYVPPRDELEEKLVEIWTEVLRMKKEEISIDQSFFRLGGHSLNLITMVAKMYNNLNVDMPISLVFKNPTIEEIAHNIRSNNMTETPIVLLNSENENKLFCFPPLIAYGFIYSYLADVIKEPAMYAFSFLEETDRLEQYVKMILEVQPTGPYRLVGYSIAGRLIFQLARALEERGYTVSDIIFFDCFINVIDDRNFAGVEQLVDDFLESHHAVYLKDKVFAKAKSYLRFNQAITHLDTINANVHLIQAESPENDYEVNDENCWDKYTTKPVKHYNGFGAHARMLVGDNLLRNSEIFREILGKILI